MGSGGGAVNGDNHIVDPDYFPDDHEGRGACLWMLIGAVLTPVVALVVLLVKVFGG